MNFNKPEFLFMINTHEYMIHMLKNHFNYNKQEVITYLKDNHNLGDIEAEFICNQYYKEEK